MRRRLCLVWQRQFLLFTSSPELWVVVEIYCSKGYIHLQINLLVILLQFTRSAYSSLSPLTYAGVGVGGGGLIRKLAAYCKCVLLRGACRVHGGAMELNGGATKVSPFLPLGSEKTSGIHGSQLSKSSGWIWNWILLNMNALLYIIELNKFLRSFQNTCQIICINRRKNGQFHSVHVKN